MDQGARGWVYKTARANYWRVSSLYEFQDLIQDAEWMWWRIVRRYPNVTEPKHLMSLFKTSYSRHLHDLSRKNSELPVKECDLATTLDVLLDVEDPEQRTDFSLMLRQLPRAIQQALVKLLDPSREHPYRERLEGGRETTNERLCRLAGTDQHRDIHTAILRYLAGAQLHPQYE